MIEVPNSRGDVAPAVNRSSPNIALYGYQDTGNIQSESYQPLACGIRLAGWTENPLVSKYIIGGVRIGSCKIRYTRELLQCSWAALHLEKLLLSQSPLAKLLLSSRVWACKWCDLPREASSTEDSCHLTPCWPRYLGYSLENCSPRIPLSLLLYCWTSQPYPH